MGFVPDKWLHSLDYGTLEKVPGSYVADDLCHRADDVVWRVKAGGEALLLQRQLARRFGQLPPDLIQRISQASAAEIELWGDRVLDAGSLDEVFSG